jgi:uncharacterized protein (DUF2252 family)
MENIVQRISDYNSTRLADMLRFKYEVMTENLFRFYRGTNHIFYDDLQKWKGLPFSPLSWISGDLHLENFGTYKGDNRLVYFDLNDFDDALLAPVSYELTRMLCSILVAFDSLKIEPKKAINMGRLFLKNYAQVLSRGKAYYIEPQTARGIVHVFLDSVSRRRQREILEKRTVKEEDTLQIYMEHPRHFSIEKKLKKELCDHMNEWIRNNNDSPNNYEVMDAAFRLAGTGSIGLKRYVFLLKSTNRKKKYILVEMKQVTESAVNKWIPVQQPRWRTQGERIASIQQRMQNIPPALLSHTVFKNDEFIIQEMQPAKDSFNFKLIRDQYRDIFQVIDDMATLTASAQIRSSGWKGADVVDKLIDFGNSTDWQEPLLEYAIHYSNQVKNDYRIFCEAHKAGHL